MSAVRFNGDKSNFDRCVMSKCLVDMQLLDRLGSTELFITGECLSVLACL
jgi:hypothetical protein